MALGNKGRGTYEFSSYLYDEKHRAIYMKKGHEWLSRSIEIGCWAIKYFQEYKEKIENILAAEYLSSDFSFRKFSLGKSKKEKQYRLWCLEESLFLNPLCEMGKETAFAHDVLTIDGIIGKLENPVSPKEFGMFNQIKQEYITARFFIFEYLFYSHKDSFVNRDTNLTDTLDYPQYGISVEKLRISYRIMYSIFDKIAFLINDYFELGCKLNQVSFRNVWMENNNQKRLREQFQNKPNLALRGLYWLSKDFFDKDDDFSDTLEPDAESLHEIRNHLEHKYLKIHWDDSAIFSEIDDPLMRDDLSYSLYESDFRNKTIRLLKMTREAIIYLSLAIYIEEYHRHGDTDELIVPHTLDRYDF